MSQDDLIRRLEEENRQLKQQLQEREQRDELYRLALEVPNEGLWDWNPITKELMISSRLMETLGHPNKTIYTTTHEWLKWVHPDDIPLYEEKVTEHLKGESDHFELEYRVKGTDNLYHWVLARGKALYDASGKAYRMVGSVGDITKRKIAEDALKQAHDTLEERVQARTIELTRLNHVLNEEIKERKEAENALNIARLEAENANVSKSKYLAAASHDLLQPMNAARLLLATLQERDLPEKETKLINRIHIALESAEDLLIDLLELARLDANAIPLDVQHFPVSRLLSLMDRELHSVAAKANVDLKVMGSSKWFVSDFRLLGRILRNYLHNAIRYARNGRVLLGCRPHGNMIRFEVWDNGPGIPEDKLELIFEEFQQLQTVNGSGLENNGIGLGLAIVEKIATALDHKISVRSKLGKGSVFSVDVPCVQPPACRTLPQELSMNNVLSDLNGKTVLIVDNEGSITHSMSELLNHWGMTPLCALSLRAALMEVQNLRHGPDCILVDYHLADQETGLDVIEALERKYDRKLPTAIISADRSTDLLKTCKAKGISILNKPLKPAKLRSLLSYLTQSS